MNLALFDFDGTITVKDCFTPFIYYAAGPKRIALGAILLSPYIIGYRLGLVSDRVIRSKLCWVAFRGKQEHDVRQFGQSYALQLNTALRTQALDRIAWHKAQGDHVVVVSSSLDMYLNDWCQQMELDLICNQLEIRQGQLTGQLINGDCGWDEKARRVNDRYILKDYPTIYAYGDTANDHAMLALADKKFFQWQEVTEPDFS